MTFGYPTDFAIEAYHEPSGPEWGGFGRMCIDIQGVRLGDIRENHCSLYDATDRLRTAYPIIDSFWDASFLGLSDAEIFFALEQALYLSNPSDWERFGRFDFLTNTGEQFDGFKTYLVCRPGGRVHILYDRFKDDGIGSASCSAMTFRRVASSYVDWFDEQVRNTVPPFFPINPFDLSETVPDIRV
jgi:hypothetical protein